MSIFRLVSLWLSNYKSSKILRLVDKKLHLIPSHKFLLLLPQLTARLSETKDLLSDLLERCTIDHPHHMISLIMALVKSNVDNPNKDAESEPRILGAQNLLDRLAKVPKLTEAIQQYHKMSDALIGLANRQSIEEIQENDPILMIKNYDAIQCPTVTLEMALDRNYKDRIVTVIKWYKHVGYVGGVNAPKKVRCLCSDGKERSQLIKGKDDLRQDAVMQQVFGIVNKTLMDHPDTKKRHLTMRTYKVVPLTRVRILKLFSCF